MTNERFECCGCGLFSSEHELVDGKCHRCHCRVQPACLGQFNDLADAYELTAGRERADALRWFMLGRRSRVELTPDPAAQFQPNFIVCERGHAPYARSFKDCPSCKVERARARSSPNPNPTADPTRCTAPDCRNTATRTDGRCGYHTRPCRCDSAKSDVCSGGDMMTICFCECHKPKPTVELRDGTES